MTMNSTTGSGISSKGIEYSKWDNLQDSSDEDEKEERQSSAMQSLPRVTRLDTPSRITATPDGTLQIHPQPQSLPQHPQQTKQLQIHHQGHPLVEGNSKSHISLENTPSTTAATSATTTATTNTTATTCPPQTQPQQQQHQTIPSSWTKNGGHVASHNLYWSQDRYEVSLRIPLPTSVVVKEVSVEWSGTILSYQNRYSATITSSLPSSDSAALQTASFVVRWNQQIILQADLPYPIAHFDNDDNDDDDNNNNNQHMDWDIEYDHSNNSTKYLHMTLLKAFPMPGMTIHWTRPIQQVKDQMTQQNHLSPSQKTSFQQAWEEAHVMFRQKVAKGEISKPPSSLSLR